MRLSSSNVIFDEKAHTYTLDGVRLQGVTGMLGDMLFPKKYENVPQFVIEKAAEKGSLIHKVVETMDLLGVENETPEGQGYSRLKRDYNLKPVASEYNVTDGKSFSSNIDKVYEGDEEDTVRLADVKTTYKLDIEYVKWQLSVYAYLFEMCNPTIRVCSQAAIWLRGDIAEYVEVDRVPNEIVKALLDYYLEWQDTPEDGRKPFLETETYKDYAKCSTTDVAPIPEKFLAMQDAIVEIETQTKEWKKRKEAVASELKEIMVESGVTKWEMGKVTVTISKPSKRNTFDTARFAEEHPDLYEEYMTETVTSPSIKFTLNKKKEK